jgi:hypothetical protein
MRSIEFTVTGPPMSAQSQNRDRLRAWQLRVREAARAVYSDAPTKDRDLEVSVTCYHDSTSPRLDGDNMVKPILDALLLRCTPRGSETRGSLHGDWQWVGGLMPARCTAVGSSSFQTGWQ